MVEGDGDGHLAGDDLHQLWIGHSRRSHDDPRHTCIRQRRGVVERPHTASHLERRPPRGGVGDRRDHRQIRRHAAPRRIEVDDVKPRRAAGAERFGDSHGIVAVRRLSLVVTLAQTHDPSTAQIDRRVELDHHDEAAAPTRSLATSSTKLPSSDRPHDADFSGWNCTAATDPTRNAAFSVDPYSHVAVTAP